MRRGAVALAAIGIALVGSLSSWLASSGSTAPSISVPPGTPSSGLAADVTTMSSSVTRSNGAALLQTGIALAKLTMSYTVTDAVRVDVSWTNATDSMQVLNNPNAFISIGVYHTIHTGSCVNSASGSVTAPLVNLTDTDSNGYCAALDQGASGKFVDSSGKLLLAADQISGYLLPSVAGSGSLSRCAAASGSPTLSEEEAEAWCQPASISDANQNSLFVVGSIVTPGGIPQGQQANLTSLNFYVQVRAAAT